MPTYSYTAINNNGSKKKGILSAASEREARKFIKDLQLTPINVSLLKNKYSSNDWTVSHSSRGKHINC